MTVSLDPRFLEKISAALKHELPGRSSHMKMSSRVRLKSISFDSDTSSAIRSSVLILLYPKDGKTHTVFMLRQTYDGVHSGQVSFPGGRAEPGDTSPVETALREAREELNIEPDKVRVLGTLSELFIPPSNFLVLPVLGYMLERPEFVPDPVEVAEVIESNLEFLFDPDLRGETVLNVRGVDIEAPYFRVSEKIIWGATAMILSELGDIIQRVK